jgi:hypothetical protein
MAAFLGVEVSQGGILEDLATFGTFDALAR